MIKGRQAKKEKTCRNKIQKITRGELQKKKYNKKTESARLEEIATLCVSYKGEMI